MLQKELNTTDNNFIYKNKKNTNNNSPEVQLHNNTDEHELNIKNIPVFSAQV